MNIEARKINLINWITSIQETDIIDEMERIQREKSDLMENMNANDKMAIEEGLSQLDNGEYLSRSQVREKINEKFDF